MKNKLKVGQTVYGEPHSNAARYNKEIKHFTVKSLGNKYFTLNDKYGNEHGYKFSYETMEEVSNYSNNWKIYLSMKEIEDKNNKPIVIKAIDDIMWKMSTDELKELLLKLENNLIIRD